MERSGKSAQHALLKQRGTPDHDLLLALFWLPFTVAAVAFLPWFVGVAAVIIQVLVIGLFAWEGQRMRTLQRKRQQDRAVASIADPRS